MPEAIPEQVEKAKKLQDLWLDEMIAMLKGEKECSATDRATIYRFLHDNGWTVDPSNMPAGLKDMLTSRVNFSEEDAEEEARLAVVK